MKAYHIVEWKRLYEVTAKSSPYNPDKPDEELRKTPIPYIRYSDNGLLLSPSYRRLAKHGNELGVMMGIAVYGLYWKLVDIARGKSRDFRGWILDEKNYPLDAEHVADILEIKDRTHVKKAFELLVYLGKMELIEVPAHFPIPADSRNSIQQREFLEPFKNVTETEDKVKEKFKRKVLRIEPEQTVEERLSIEYPEAACSSQAPPPDKDSDKDSVKVTGDTVSATDSATDSVTVTVTAPTEGPGRNKQEGAVAKQLFLLELTKIIRWHNQSDKTTLCNIADQLEYRFIYETTEDLFAEALKKAAGCAEIGRNPLAMFVTAMKKSPFYYIPKGTSFIRGAKDKYNVQTDKR